MRKLWLGSLALSSASFTYGLRMLILVILTSLFFHFVYFFVFFFVFYFVLVLLSCVRGIIGVCLVTPFLIRITVIAHVLSTPISSALRIILFTFHRYLFLFLFLIL